MHRSFDIVISPSHTDRLVGELEPMKYVLGVAVFRGVSLKPEGDVVRVSVLNRGADAVLRSVERAREGGATATVATSELASIIDPEHADLIKDDIDEEIWEELETGLRHQGHLTVNFVLLMALAGAIAAVGLVSEPVPQLMVFVAASILAPGFEPIAKIPLGLVLRRWDVLWRGVVAFAVGYGALAGAAALVFLALVWSGNATVGEFVASAEVRRIAAITPRTLVVSTCAALAAVTISSAYRETIMSGPIIALVLVPAAAIVGAALVTGQWDLFAATAVRFATDVAIIVVVSACFYLWKQWSVHRRRPLV